MVIFLVELEMSYYSVMLMVLLEGIVDIKIKRIINV